MKPMSPKPNRLRVAVHADRIVVDNDTPGAQAANMVWGLPAGTVVFVIENCDKVRHTVKIPVGEFGPSASYKDATPAPLVAGQQESIDVEPGDRPDNRAVLAFRIRPFAHFGFDRRAPWMDDPSLPMTYKFNIHSQPAGRSQIDLDPDLEIDRP